MNWFLFYNEFIKLIDILFVPSIMIYGIIEAKKKINERYTNQINQQIINFSKEMNYLLKVITPYLSWGHIVERKYYPKRHFLSQMQIIYGKFNIERYGLEQILPEDKELEIKEKLKNIDLCFNHILQRFGFMIMIDENKNSTAEEKNKHISDAHEVLVTKKKQILDHLVKEMNEITKELIIKN